MITKDEILERSRVAMKAAMASLGADCDIELRKLNDCIEAIESIQAEERSRKLAAFAAMRSAVNEQPRLLEAPPGRECLPAGDRE